MRVEIFRSCKSLLYKVGNIVLSDQIKIFFLLTSSEERAMRDTKTYRFCIHHNSLPLWENFVLFILFVHPIIFWASALSCYGYSNTCGELEQTFKYVSLAEFKMRDFIMLWTSGLRGFEHILWTILSRCSILSLQSSV